MIELKDLLVRFEKILGQESTKIHLVQDLLKEILGVEVLKEDIKIRNKKIYLKIKPILKNVILFKKEVFLKKLSQKGVHIEDVL